MNTYARTRQHRLSDLVEAVANSINPTPGYTTEPQREILEMGNRSQLTENNTKKMVEAPGIEPGSGNLPPQATTRVVRVFFLADPDSRGQDSNRPARIGSRREAPRAEGLPSQPDKNFALVGPIRRSR